VSLRADRSLIAYLGTHGATRPYVLLTQSSDQASPLILLGLPASAVGGYNTTDPAMSGAQLATLVSAHKARYIPDRRSLRLARRKRRLAAARLVCPEVRA